MKIKEVEQRVGITRANIRYYEEEGLLNPVRNRENNYREYSEEDVKNLERIKVLRALGIPISDVKMLNAGALSLDEVMEKRLERISEEEKNLREIEKVCRTIRQLDISFEEVDEQILGEEKDIWEEQFEKIWKEDITKEILTLGQLNKNLTWMLVWGYFMNAVIALLFGDFFLRYEGMSWSKRIAAIKSNPGEILNRQTLFFDQWKWLILAVIVCLICYIGMYFTANVKALTVFFHLEALVLTPFIAGISLAVRSVFSTEKVKNQTISGMHLAIFWLAMVLYVLLLFLLSGKKQAFFSKARYVLGMAVVYAIILTVLAGILSDRWIPAAVMSFIFTIYIGLSWFHVIGDAPKSGGSRYYAIVSATKMMNIAGAAFTMQGKSRGTTILR